MNTIYQTKRNRAEQDEVLEAFAARLREHPLLNTATVVVDDQPVPVAFPHGGYLMVVAPGAGEFPHNIWADSHHASATEDSSVIIGIYAQSFKGKLGNKQELLTSRKPGKPSLLQWKRAALKLLCVSDELNAIGEPHIWEPAIGDRPLLRDLPQPVRCTAPMDVPDHAGWYGIQLTFSCTWDWDLYRA